MKNFFSKKEKKEFLRQLKTLFIPISRTQKTRQIRQIGGKRIESVRARARLGEFKIINSE